MFGFTNEYLTKDGKPWFPVMGEFHYSRFSCGAWLDSLFKMKTGGVSIVSSYVFWIHHEEIEGKADFSGNKDIAAFVRACGEAGLYVFLRIGPWCHGEVRNGGFPDWLLKYDVRTNDAGYLEQAERFYALIFEQVKGLLHKDGGPIIGIQIENEYGHVGGLGGEEGELHMRNLLAIAKKTGFDVPYYTATGWGGAVTGGMLPVMGGYCEAPWDQRLTEIEPSGNYIFTHERYDKNIESGCELGEGLTFDMACFPYLAAELGGGLQVTKHRRPVATSRDIGAMSLVKIGSGANLLGYYMYHGGTNPKGALTSLQETRATSHWCDLPELSYDFQTAIGEYGQITDTYGEIKLLAYFLSDFGSDLAGMPAYIPEGNPLKPDNFTDLRWCVRHNGERGFVFVNNYQRRRVMAEHNDVSLEIRLNGNRAETTRINIKDGDYFFYPLNMPVCGGVIKWATATPFCMDGRTAVFYGEKDAVFITEGDPDYRLISRDEALNAYRCGGKLIFSEHPAVEKSGGACESIVSSDAGGCCELSKAGEGRYIVYIKYPEFFDDCYLRVDYAGESARAYVNGVFSADNYYTGLPWVISMKHVGFPGEITLEIETLHEGDAVFLEEWPVMKNGKTNRVDAVSMTREARVQIQSP